jgi:hypothetical protein
VTDFAYGETVYPPQCDLATLVFELDGQTWYRPRCMCGFVAATAYESYDESAERWLGHYVRQTRLELGLPASAVTGRLAWWSRGLSLRYVGRHRSQA